MSWKQIALALVRLAFVALLFGAAGPLLYLLLRERSPATRAVPRHG